MPEYEYECEKCKRTFEVEQKISDEPLAACILPDTRTVEERMLSFNNTTGCLYGGNQHPDQCACQREERGENADTPHKHYENDPPLFPCARCRCSEYKPLFSLTCAGPVRRLIAGSTGFVLNGKGWFKDGY